MPSYKVENGSARDKAIKVFGGMEVVKRGKTVTLENATEMSDEQIADFAAQGVTITDAGKAKAASKTAKAEPKE